MDILSWYHFQRVTSLKHVMLCPSDLLVITPVSRLSGSLQGCQDEKAAWEDIYRQGRQTFFIVVIAWNKGFIYIGEEMVLTALRSSLRSKVQRSSAVLEFPPLSGTPSLLVRTSNWSLSTRTCKEHWSNMRYALNSVAHCV